MKAKQETNLVLLSLHRPNRIKNKICFRQGAGLRRLMKRKSRLIDHKMFENNWDTVDI